MLSNSFGSKYVRGEKIGEGQHSSVYKCFTILDKEQEHPLAVKVTREDDEEKKEATRKEFKIMMGLNHPGITEGIEIFENDLDGEILTIMSYNPGVELKEA